LCETHITKYLEYAKTNNYNYILILRDQEDKEIYPVYFKNIRDRDSYIKNMLSEMKVDVLELLIVKEKENGSSAP
jgi:hypothetical protein